MKNLLTSVAVIASLCTPAVAGIFDTDETTITGIYYALAYDNDCKPGALTEDSKEVISFWLKQTPNNVKGRAMLKVKEASSNYGTELFCLMLRKAVEPQLNTMNSTAAKFISTIR